jgi:hypothetical protein
MDEAFSEERRAEVSAVRATELMNAGTIKDRHLFYCLDEDCGVPLRLDSMASTQKAPYFISCAQPACLKRRGYTHDPTNTPAEYHRDDCEYVTGDAGGSQQHAYTLHLSGELTLDPGSVSAPSKAASRASGSPPRLPTPRVPINERLKLRSLVDYMVDWPALAVARASIQLQNVPRPLPTLFVPAHWLPEFDLRNGRVRWPGWAGKVRHFDATEYAVVAYGDAELLSVRADLPVIRFLEPAFGRRGVAASLDEGLYRRSAFQRRFARDLAATGWIRGKAVRAYAYVMGTVRMDAMYVRVDLLTTFENVRIFPNGHGVVPGLEVAHRPLERIHELRIL